MDTEDLRVELSTLESLDANTVSILPDTEGEWELSKPAGLTKRLGNFLKGIGRGVK